jgi:hypothetical protein
MVPKMFLDYFLSSLIQKVFRKKNILEFKKKIILHKIWERKGETLITKN